MAKTSSQILDAVKEFFDFRLLKFTYSGDALYVEVNLEKTFNAVDIFVHVEDDGFTVHFYLPIKAQDNVTKVKVSEFINRANCEMSYGRFELDFDSGDVRFKTSHFCGGNVPSNEAIEHAIFGGIKEIEWYGDALSRVIRGVSTPREALDNLYV